jgi:hypothetical protein
MLSPANDLLLQTALRALEESTGIRHDLDPEAASEDRCRITLTFPGKLNTDGREVTYEALLRQIDRPDKAIALMKTFNANATHSHFLLVAPRITEATAKALRGSNLEYLDAGGNAHLRGEHHHILIQGLKAPDLHTVRANEGGTSTTSALRIIFAVLCHPPLLNATYREIARSAGVALGTVGPVLDDLERRRFTTGTRPSRRLIDPLRLLDEWATNYPTRLRPKLHPRRFKAGVSDWISAIDLSEYGGWWGSEVAADRYTHYLKAATTTIYLNPKAGKLTSLVAKARMRPDPNGEIEILDAFWDLPPDQTHPDVVPRVLAYADLLASLDPRNIEVARMLHQEQIARGYHQAEDPG